MRAALVLLAIAIPGCYGHHERPEPLCDGVLALRGAETGRAGESVERCRTLPGGYPIHAGPFVVDGDVAYRHADDLEVIDVSDPRSPVLVRRVEALTCAGAHAVLAGDALVVAGAYTEVFDVSDRWRPVGGRVLPLAASAVALAVSGTTVFSASMNTVRGDAISTARLDAFDVSDPLRPLDLGSLVVGAGRVTSRLALADGTAWVDALDLSDGTGAVELVGIDVRDPRAMRIVSRTPLPAGRDVSLGVEGHFVWVGIGRSIDVYDVSEPRAPELAFRHEGTEHFVFLGGGAAIASMGALGGAASDVAFFDAWSPERLALGERTRMPVGWNHARVVGDALLLSDADALHAFPIECASR